MRAVVSCSSVSRRRRSSGNSGVSFSKFGRPRATSGSSPLTESILSRALYFSLSLGSRTWPCDLVAAAQAEAADLRKRDVDVVVALRVAAGAQEAEAVGQHVEDARDLIAGALLARLAPARRPASLRGPAGRDHAVATALAAVARAGPADRDRKVVSDGRGVGARIDGFRRTRHGPRLAALGCSAGPRRPAIRSRCRLRAGRGRGLDDDRLGWSARGLPSAVADAAPSPAERGGARLRRQRSTLAEGRGLDAARGARAGPLAPGSAVAGRCGAARVDGESGGDSAAICAVPVTGNAASAEAASRSAAGRSPARWESVRRWCSWWSVRDLRALPARGVWNASIRDACAVAPAEGLPLG